jgi:hypothetical protein
VDKLLTGALGNHMKLTLLLVIAVLLSGCLYMKSPNVVPVVPDLSPCSISVGELLDPESTWTIIKTEEFDDRLEVWTLVPNNLNHVVQKVLIYILPESLFIQAYIYPCNGELYSFMREGMDYVPMHLDDDVKTMIWADLYI